MSVGLLITNLYDLVGGNHQWSVSTIFSQGRQTVTLQFAPHVPNATWWISASRIPNLFDSHLQFETFGWLKFTHTLLPGGRPAERRESEVQRSIMVFLCCFGLGICCLNVVSPCSFSPQKYPRQPVWNRKIAGQSWGELGVWSQVGFLFVYVFVCLFVCRKRL